MRFIRCRSGHQGYRIRILDTMVRALLRGHTISATNPSRGKLRREVPRLRDEWRVPRRAMTLTIPAWGLNLKGLNDYWGRYRSGSAPTSTICKKVSTSNTCAAMHKHRLSDFLRFAAHLSIVALPASCPKNLRQVSSVIWW